MVPFPLYTCVHVKKDVSAQAFCGEIISMNFTLGPVFMKGEMSLISRWESPRDKRKMFYMSGFIPGAQDEVSVDQPQPSIRDKKPLKLCLN